MSRNLYVFACGAAPAHELPELVRLALAEDWDVFVGSTPSGWAFLDVGQLTNLTGRPPRRDYSGRTSGWPPADGVILAPATINTVNKIASGIVDNWAVNVIVECLGLDVATVIAPNVNPALGRHPRYRQNIDELRSWGVSVLWHPDGFAPPMWMVPWPTMLDALHAAITR